MRSKVLALGFAALLFSAEAPSGWRKYENGRDGYEIGIDTRPHAGKGAGYIRSIGDLEFGARVPRVRR